MLIIEVMLTVLLAVAGVVLLLGWLLRPVVRKMREQLRLEGQVELNRRAFEAERSQLREAARAEFEQWMKARAGEAAGAGSPVSLTRLQSPVLQAVLERYPLNDRVLELARVYKQATGKDLLPPDLRSGDEAGEDPKNVTRPEAALSNEEARLLEEAKREVDAWLTVAGAESDPHSERQR